MALGNSEFNLIMREYEERRLFEKKELSKRQEEVFEKIPEIKEIQSRISSEAVNSMRNRLLKACSTQDENEELHNVIEMLKKRKSELLVRFGYPEDYLKMRYECEDCQDTGYIGNEKCHCLKKKITDRLYSRSNLRKILKMENFQTFDVSLYSEKFVDDVTGKNARENILDVLNKCRNFVEEFKDGSSNLLIYGETGVGKTFLTNCIAKELMDKSYSVIYVSAIRMFEVLAAEQFGKSEEKSGSAGADFAECDLLIIDDLGTELVNSFTTSALFNCINERFLRGRSVIISTNLSIGDIRTLYSERIFSRIASDYTILKVFGRDLRIAKSLGLTKE